MQGVTTHVSAPKSSTACTKILKKNADTCIFAPSQLRIIIILFHTAIAFEKFLTTAGQLSSIAEITFPRYQKEVTISRGCT